MLKSIQRPSQSEKLFENNLLRVAYYEHPKLPHSDPSEEQWDGYHIVFTETGRWLYRDRFGRHGANPQIVILGAFRQFYACRHEEEMPEDRCLEIRLNEPMLREALSPRNGLVFPFSAIRVTPRLTMLKERIRRLALGGAEEIEIDEVGENLVTELARIFRGNLVLSPLPLNRRRRDSIEAAKEFIAKHFTEDLRLDDLASAVGLSSFHFSRIFRSHVGKSPYRYLRDMRLQTAAKFLCDGDRTVTDIAYDVGFQNLSLFINSFRSAFGASPSRFRKDSLIPQPIQQKARFCKSPAGAL